MNSTPLAHRWITTEDGSETLYSEAFQEACHSTTGARAETLLHYIQGCQVVEKAGQLETISILEVGFGTGLGLLTTMESLKSGKSHCRFVSLELDKNLINWFREQHPDIHFKEIQAGELNYIEAQKDNFTITILIGNGRKTLPAYLNLNPLKWDAIYQDAFSPKRNPVLWTSEWFRLLKESSQPEVILSTYSASNSIRKSLLEAGWKIHKGEKFGPKRTSTRATLIGDTDSEIIQQLQHSPVKAMVDADLPGELFT